MDKADLDLIRNAAFPQGELGLQMIDGMNRGHAELTQWGFQHITFGSRILDVGCGGGAALNVLANLLSDASLVGCDISPLAVKSAREFNSEFTQSGRMIVKQTGVPNLDLPDNSFDVVYSIESLYFWSDVVAGLQDVLRVLIPGGTFMTALEMVGGAMSAHHEEIAKELKMFCPSPDELENEIKQAGFIEVVIDENRTKGWVCAVAKKSK